MSLRVGRSAAPSDELLQALTTSTNDSAVEPAGHFDGGRGLFSDLFRDNEDSGLGLSNSLLGAADTDARVVLVLGSLVDVDLNAIGVLNVIDGRTGLTEDARDRASRNRELDDVVRLLLELDGLCKHIS